MLSDPCFELNDEVRSRSFDITEGSTITLEMRRNSISHITERVGSVQYKLSVARFYSCVLESSLYCAFTYYFPYY